MYWKETTIYSGVHCEINYTLSTQHEDISIIHQRGYDIPDFIIPDLVYDVHTIYYTTKSL